MNKREEVKKQLHDLNEQISILRNQYYKIRESEITELQDELRKHVGRCFKQPSGDTWCIIYDIPQPEYCMTHTDFNENQMPAMFLHKLPEIRGGLPFIDYDTFFTGDFPEDPRNILNKHHWQEVSLPEFWEVYEKFVKDLGAKVQGRVASAAAIEFQKLGQSRLSEEKSNGGWFETNKKIADEMNGE